MNRYLLIILFIFSIPTSAQTETIDIQNVYLSDLLNSIEDASFTLFDTDNIKWRKSTVKKITSKDNLIETSYIKTAMVLHMLKYKLGDTAFYKGIGNYKEYLKNEDVPLDLADFQAYLEDESGVELTHFFNDWFKGRGHPSYQINWFQNETTNEISFSVKQTQNNVSNSFFEIPVPIVVKGARGASQSIRLELSENGQSFTGSIPFKAEAIEIDPEHNIISKNNIAKVGIDQEVLNTTISLYPNPTTDMIRIQNSSDAVVERVSFYNMLGKLVLEKLNPLAAAINLQELSVGVHLVKIETTQGTLHKTILKK
tara:strand:+ start:222159 stop:223094 length:936 start_codon:yes stop_codon:yes gene_type:complete